MYIVIKWYEVANNIIILLNLYYSEIPRYILDRDVTGSGDYEYIHHIRPKSVSIIA